MELCGVPAKTGDRGFEAHKILQYGIRVRAPAAVRVNGVALAAVLEAASAVDFPKRIHAARLASHQVGRETNGRSRDFSDP